MTQKMNRGEFIALIAMMFATIAFSIDAMLPALPDIGQQLSPDDINRAQLILTSFVLGMGLGTFVTGPLSDALGRKRVIAGGAVIYIAAAAIAWQSSTLEVVLAARVLQGLGAAGPRVVALAVMRDLYSGREMARLVSIAMMIFTIFPAFAPLIGSGIIAVAGWRGIFLVFILFALIMVLWMIVRLPESLPRENRRPMRVTLMVQAVGEMVRHPTVRLSILVQTLCMSVLFVMISTVQQVYDVVYGRGDQFPYIFAGVALVSGSASLLNAAIVVRVGMRRIVTWSVVGQAFLSAAILLLSQGGLPDDLMFFAFVGWQATVFFFAGTTMGNLNAIAMEPMGHIAGMAASVMGALATVGAVVLAAPVGLLFNGTLVPMAAGILIYCLLGWGLMALMARQEER